MARQSFKLAPKDMLKIENFIELGRPAGPSENEVDRSEEFFGEIPLRKITAEKIVEYHQKAEGRRAYLEETINMEVGLLRRILKR